MAFVPPKKIHRTAPEVRPLTKRYKLSFAERAGPSQVGILFGCGVGIVVFGGSLKGSFWSS